MKLSGGGKSMNKNVSPPVKTGSPSTGSSPGAADQLGQAVAFPKDQADAVRGYDGAPYGNQLALNSKTAPGQGRTIHRSGSQSLHGAISGSPRPAGRDILSRRSSRKFECCAKAFGQLRMPLGKLAPKACAELRLTACGANANRVLEQNFYKILKPHRKIFVNFRTLEKIFRI